MERQVFFLSSPLVRRNASYACAHAPEGWMAVISEPAKRRIQEERYHAMLGDIAKQVEFFGQKRDDETTKRLLIDAFARIRKEENRPLAGHGAVLPSLDGMGVVQLGVQSRAFSKDDASEFIEYLFAFGAEHSVIWSDPTMKREAA